MKFFYRRILCAISAIGISWPMLALTFSGIYYQLNSKIDLFQDPDTYMHLEIGHWILNHHSVPSVDPFSYTMPGAPWVAHEWLSEIIMAFVYDTLGGHGLAFLTVICFGLTLGYLMRFLLKRVPPIYAIFFTTLAFLTFATHVLARPHILTWPIMIVWFGTLFDTIEQDQTPPWYLLLLMPIWANLHGGFTLGLMLLPAFAIESVWNTEPASRHIKIKKWGIFIIGSGLAAMVTPFGWDGLWLSFHLISMESVKFIDEWMSASFSSLSPLELWIIALLGLSLFGYLRLSLIRIALLLALLHQALAHVRFISVFGFMAAMIIAKPFGEIYRENNTGRANSLAVDQLFDLLSKPTRPLAIGLCAMLLMGSALLASANHEVFPSKTLPVAAVDAALKAGVKGQVLNWYNIGGYLIFRKIPVYIDGRADLYGDQFFGDYHNAMILGKELELRKVLENPKIQWTIFPPESPVIPFLDKQSGWKRIYTDKLAIVHIRVI